MRVEEQDQARVGSAGAQRGVEVVGEQARQQAEELGVGVAVGDLGELVRRKLASFPALLQRVADLAAAPFIEDADAGFGERAERGARKRVGGRRDDLEGVGRQQRVEAVGRVGRQSAFRQVPEAGEVVAREREAVLGEALAQGEQAVEGLLQGRGAAGLRGEVERDRGHGRGVAGRGREAGEEVVVGDLLQLEPVTQPQAVAEALADEAQQQRFAVAAVAVQVEDRGLGRVGVEVGHAAADRGQAVGEMPDRPAGLGDRLIFVVRGHGGAPTPLWMSSA